VQYQSGKLPHDEFEFVHIPAIREFPFDGKPFLSTFYIGPGQNQRVFTAHKEIKRGGEEVRLSLCWTEKSGYHWAEFDIPDSYRLKNQVAFETEDAGKEFLATKKRTNRWPKMSTISIWSRG
jgi:hypothetical protein